MPVLQPVAYILVLTCGCAGLMPLPGRFTPPEMQSQGQLYSAPQLAVSPQLPASVLPLDDVVPADPGGVNTLLTWISLTEH